jgi:hypothetical protein
MQAADIALFVAYPAFSFTKKNKMATENNMAPGQQNAPENGKTVYPPDQADGDEIINGAKNDDQLKKIEENAEKWPAEHVSGAMPDKDLISQQDIKNGVNTYEQQKGEHMALETKEGKNNGAIPKAFENQQSNHP